MICNKIISGILFLFVITLLVLPCSVFSQEVNEEFQNYPFEAQTGVFVATFNAKATADSVDGVLGFSKDEPDSYGDYSCKVLFNNEGYITANDGSSFTADSAVTYVADQTFAVKVLFNIPAQTFSVWVTPEGGEEVAIGKNFAFYPDLGVIDTLKYRSVKMSFGFPWGGNVGVVKMTDFAISQSEDFVNTAIDPQTGVFVATFNAKATADSVDGVLGLAMNE
ncbi:hypothetical protein JXQ31_13170, partial [candidate division KSB1 bacterium]|nr:hypothetical protein [candidate division KSB1 bacterium]